MDNVWNGLYANNWGAKWPDENLIRFMETRYRIISVSERKLIKVLDLGCGPGRNLWYLRDAGFSCEGIEGVKIEGSNVPIHHGDLTDMHMFADKSFDVCIDICSIQHNCLEDIVKIANEIFRILKPDGILFAVLRSDDFYDYPPDGKCLERHTYMDIEEGDLKSKGIVHFFDKDEIYEIFGKHFDIKSIDMERRTTNNGVNMIVHHILIAQKRG